MKLLTLFISALLLSLAADAQSSTTSAADSSTLTRYVRLVPEAFHTTLAALPNEQLIDVRTPTEYAQGHLPEATLIDFRSPHFERNISRLDQDRPVMIYCAKGGRSTAAATRLRKLGFREIYELDGGFTEWIRADRPVAQ